MRGRDFEVAVPISIDEAYHGTQIELDTIEVVLSAPQALSNAPANAATSWPRNLCMPTPDRRPDLNADA